MTELLGKGAKYWKDAGQTSPSFMDSNGDDFDNGNFDILNIDIISMESKEGNVYQWNESWNLI